MWPIVKRHVGGAVGAFVLYLLVLSVSPGDRWTALLLIFEQFNSKEHSSDDTIATPPTGVTFSIPGPWQIAVQSQQGCPPYRKSAVGLVGSITPTHDCGLAARLEASFHRV